MMRVVSAIVLMLCAICLFGEPAFADRRIALVIGNSAYERVPQLPNPANDATAMAEMFKKAGFEAVTLKLDLKAVEMRRTLRDFVDAVRDADLAIIYYAGHGLEIDGSNYLVPVDAVLERDIDAYDEAIPLDRLLAVVEPAKRLRMVILDACRDNPFAKRLKRPVASRSLQRGLVMVEPNSPNTLVAFAAKAGSTADDGDSRNSPFTTALVKHLPVPGLDVRKAFGFVRDDVLKVTNYKQEPFIYGSLGGDDVALVPLPPAPKVDPLAAARDDYQLTSQINVIAAWESFLAKYPTGFYSDLARAQRDKLIAARDAEQARLAAEKKARDDAKAAEDARAAKAAEDARAAKAAEEAKAAKAAEDSKAAKAAEEARAAKAAEEARVAKAAEAARIAKAAEDAKAAKAAEAARAAKAAEEAKAADAARAKAAQPAPGQQLAAIVPHEIRPAPETGKVPPRAQGGCAGAEPQSAALSLDTARALSLPEECSLKPKQSFRECQNCPEMVVVPPGEFMMGSSTGEISNGLAAANEAPQHKVVVSQPLALGRFEVTRDQFAAFVAASGYKAGKRCFTFEQNVPQEREGRSYLMPGYAQDGNHPAVCVSWNDAQAYVDWLSKTTGKPYRLLSEAEFEYAARAGSTLPYAYTDNPADLCRYVNGADQAARNAGLPQDAPYMACSDGYPFTAPVGAFKANAFGLADLIGNVWEWTADCYADDYRGAGADSAARSQDGCTAHTLRGGDWFSAAGSLRPAIRAKAGLDARHDDIGFRVARTLVH
ncbi:SUMF1/EgtB/PvdO family nonheme iron enzyme [Bradyrhizobium sp. BR 10289]|uniref:SUMF1/EgtB/PvdO family nonheme iron enzyme n=1 Tax=Bradyrhizobium sp. BR 10289 TaxID=2749993 RepID=UPI001C651C3C|nr:SUMF1/EgtB/PvdO family nonheme iron enzyme [Bradyrhizobium sp. BR 10289]MBW7971040.1 SUMF1/EgtB/PvdO family nonheme iron enzyme [Bradyrhizobium sp. BR 10289]